MYKLFCHQFERRKTSIFLISVVCMVTSFTHVKWKSPDPLIVSLYVSHISTISSTVFPKVSLLALQTQHSVPREANLWFVIYESNLTWLEFNTLKCVILNSEGLTHNHRLFILYDFIVSENHPTRTVLLTNHFLNDVNYKIIDLSPSA